MTCPAVGWWHNPPPVQGLDGEKLGTAVPEGTNRRSLPWPLRWPRKPPLPTLGWTPTQLLASARSAGRSLHHISADCTVQQQLVTWAAGKDALRGDVEQNFQCDPP